MTANSIENKPMKIATFPSAEFQTLNSQLAAQNPGNVLPGHAPAHSSPIDPGPTRAPVAVPAHAHALPSDAPNRNRIERLPSNIREQVNQFIEDDKPFAEIIQWLASAGHAAITAANLIQYAEGQRCCDDERIDREAA